MFFSWDLWASYHAFHTVKISGQTAVHALIFKGAHKGGERDWVQINFWYCCWVFGVRFYGFQDFMQSQFWVGDNL